VTSQTAALTVVQDADILIVSPVSQRNSAGSALRNALAQAGFRQAPHTPSYRLFTYLTQNDSADTSAATLRDELRHMHSLRAIIACGTSAHLVALSACGVPLSHVPYRPGLTTRLPDGLFLIDMALTEGHAPTRQTFSPLINTLSQLLTSDPAEGIF